MNRKYDDEIKKRIISHESSQLRGSEMEKIDDLEIKGEKYQTLESPSKEVLEKVEKYCPLCNKVHVVEKRKRIGEMLIKNEIVSYEEVYFFCPKSVNYEEDEFVSAGLMNQNLQNARNAYRKKHRDFKT